MFEKFVEIILGLPGGFLSRQGHLTLQFNPDWPLEQYVGGAAVWNFLLAGLAIALVIFIYRREVRTPRLRILLSSLRLAILGLVLLLLNRPVLTLGQARREPSVLAFLIDDSISMKVPDATGDGGKSISRLDAVQDLLTGSDDAMLRHLSSVHDLRFYDFSRGARQIATVDSPDSPTAKPTPEASAAIDSAAAAVEDLKPKGDGTQIVSALSSVLQDLQGQRVAGVVILTDGRETPSESSPEAVAALKSYGINIYPVAVGSDRMPRNIAVQSVTFEDTAFVGDYTNLHVTLQASGYEPNHSITLQLMRQVTEGGRTTKVPVLDDSGNPITKIVEAPTGEPFDTDLQFKPTAADIPVANLVVEAVPQPGEIDDSQNDHPARLQVVDDNISVLYVDGYPRWDYRYLKNSLLRDKTVKLSCLLTSADPDFRQEGSDDPNRPQYQNSWRITAFPDTMDRLMDYDAIIIGDVDPRQFTDAQLQLISDFVSKKGGGFAMVAGPRYSPQGYRNTPIESLLPVIITHAETDDQTTQNITAGFHLLLTRAARNYPIFRFFPQWADDEELVDEHLQELFWYCHGIMVKPGVGIVLAEHPTDLGPDGRKAPILVVGNYGAGRTIFSAIDDSWRWRYYTGESIFNSYWVQQLRFLSRGRKIGQRKLTFTADHDVYELGNQVNLRFEALSPELQQQLSPPLAVEVVDDNTGQPTGRVELQKMDPTSAVYTGSFTADRIGQFTMKLPHLTDNDPTVSLKVAEPQTELRQPQLDTAFLRRIGSVAPIPIADAAGELSAIRSAARIIPIDVTQPLWNAPLVLAIFAVLITVEWIVRKMVGLL